MKARSLAVVLVKVLGFSLTIYGILSIVSTICSSVYSGLMMMEFHEAIKHSSSSIMPPPNYFWQTLTTTGVHSVLEFALGLFSIKKASYIVERVLSIEVEP